MNERTIGQASTAGNAALEQMPTSRLLREQAAGVEYLGLASRSITDELARRVSPAPRYQVQSDAAGRWFGAWDTRDQAWLSWGLSRADATAIVADANRLDGRR